MNGRKNNANRSDSVQINYDEYNQSDDIQIINTVHQPVNNNQNFNISLIIKIVIVVVIGYVIISFLLTFFSTDKLAFNKKNAFIASARSYIASASVLHNGSSCNGKIVSLTKISDERNGDRSPFGNKFNLEKSYVKIEATRKGGRCNKTYYIYLTDDVYSVGSIDNPILESELSVEKINE